jgi:hypothetical protein
MKAYVYRAALYCHDCVTGICRDLAARGYHAIKAQHPELTYDSDAFPQGPYLDGGGEADCPQHCDCCGVFLENPLTSDGERYVQDAIAQAGGNPAVLNEWHDFYKYLFA